MFFEVDDSNKFHKMRFHGSVDENGRNLNQLQNGSHAYCPFELMLRLVHPGVAYGCHEGEEHQVLVFGGCDDSKLAMKIFSVFVPSSTP